MTSIKPNVSRKYFKAVRLKTDSGTGIGIIRYSVGETLELASLYFDEQLSHKQSFEVVAKYVVSRLATGETAKLRFGNMKIKRSYCEPYNDRIKFALVSPGTHMNEPRLLAQDALERKSSIEMEL